jgi:hypothetical protein
MATKVFGMSCACESDGTCRCTNHDENIRFDFSHLSIKQMRALADEIESLPPEARVSLTKQLLATKGTDMTTTVKFKFADVIKSATKEEIVEAISAAAPSMSMEDRLFWIRALQSSAPSKHDSRVNRLNTVLKACAAGDGKAYNAVLRCQRDLKSLGLPDDLDKHAESGYAVGDVDKAMKKAGWNTERRIETKSRLDNLGLLAV